MNTHILLTISILISNRPDTVRKCLDSIQPLLKKVPSELILVDTGCGEQVRSVIEEYTDNIVDFVWCRNFAKARNAGLERARGEWFMYMDDDEWFEDVRDIIRFFNSGEFRIYGVGLYTTRDYIRTDGSQYIDSLAARMVRLEPDIRFIYRIHECFNRAPGKAKRIDAFTHHYGYAYQTAEKAREHAARNIGLLQEELAEHPSNMRHMLQLVQEYNALGEAEKSLELSLEAIERAKAGAVEEEYCLSSLYGNAINGYIVTYQYDEAIRKGEEYIKSKRTDRMVKALIAGRLAVAYVDKEDYGKAFSHAKNYWDTYQAYLKNRDAFIGFETPVTQSCFNKQKRTPILGNGVRAAVHCGQAVWAWKWFREMDWRLEKYSLDFGVIRDILKCMAGADMQELPLYEKMCNVILERQDLEEVVLEDVLECCDIHEEMQDGGEMDFCEEAEGCRVCDSQIFRKRTRGISAFGNLPIEHWFIRLARLTAAAFWPERGISCRGEEAEAMALEIWKAREESMLYMKAYHMPQTVNILGGDMGHMLEEIPFSQWEKALTDHFSRYTWKDTVWLAKAFRAVREQDSMRMLAWRAACGISRASWETAALENMAEESDGFADNVLGGLREYALCRIKLCEEIYKEKIIRSMPDLLPEEYQGAYVIRNLLEKTEAAQYAEAVESVREIMNLLPGLAPIMRHYLKWLEIQLERQKKESTQAAGELQVLARQIKARVHTLMDAGQYEAALGVTEQLLPLLPGDGELQNMQKEIISKLRSR
nr:glycosyltransferase [uncultured Acetatifactor sp.]